MDNPFHEFTHLVPPLIVAFCGHRTSERAAAPVRPQHASRRWSILRPRQPGPTSPARAALKRRASLANATRSSCPPPTRKGERHARQPLLRIHRRIARAGDEHEPLARRFSPSHGRPDPRRHLGQWGVELNTGESHPVPRFSSSAVTGSRPSGGPNSCAVCCTALIRSTP